MEDFRGWMVAQSFSGFSPLVPRWRFQTQKEGVPGPRAPITLRGHRNVNKGALWPLGGPLGGVTSAPYTVGETLSLL